MNEEHLKATFNALRPVCVKLTKEHTKENVAILFTSVRKVAKQELQDLQEYVLFPLRLLLKQSQSRSQDLYIDVLECFCFIIEQTSVSKWEMFQDIFNTFCILINPVPNHGDNIEGAEELKLGIVKCLKMLVKHSDESVLMNLFTLDFLPSLGHCISVLLTLAEKEQNRQIRTDSLDCIIEMAMKNRKDQELLIQAGETFASFLPGIAMTTCKIITGDTKQGQSVTVTATETWTAVVCLVMGDAFLKQTQNQKKQNKETKKQASDIEAKVASLKIQRTAQWTETTAEKMKIIVEKVATVTTHKNWRVRLALVEWAKSLLLQCKNSLKSSIPITLKVLVSLLEDDYPNVAKRSKQALGEFQEKQKGIDETPLVQILEENLHALATALPRIMRTADDEKKLANLQLFSGYLNLLGPRINCLLHSFSHLERTSLALTQVLELDCSHIQGIQEKTSVSDLKNKDQIYNGPRKYYSHFCDEKIVRELIKICNILGHYGDLNILVDHFMDLFHQSSVHRKPSIFIINEIMAGTIQKGIGKKDCHNTEDYDLESLIRSLIEDYLTEDNFHLQISNQPELLLQKDDSQSTRYQSQPSTNWQIVPTNFQTGLTIRELNSNIWQICLLLEGIGVFAKVLGSTFKFFLMDILYPVLEKLGCENSAISQSAYLALVDVCKACQYNSIEDLLCENADYLVNSISLKLRHLSRNPQAPSVLQVTLRYSKKEMLLLVDDTIQEMLSALDQHHDEKGDDFMKVLYSLVVAIHKWYPTESSTQVKDQDPTNFTQDKLLGPEGARDYLADHIKQRNIANGIVDEEELDKDIDMETCPENESNEPKEEEKKILRHVQIVVQILERCKHLLSSSNPRLRLLVLTTIAGCCHALQDHTDELLPELHKVWSAFVKRFQDEEILVIVKAVEVLGVMAEVSKDFLRKRVVKEIFPKLIGFLQKQAKSSELSGPAYKYTSSFKLQSMLLHKCGQLCEWSDIQSQHLATLMQGCVPYLSVKQPKELQKAAVEAFMYFIKLDPDKVWYIINNLYCTDDYVPPAPEFAQIKVFGGRTKNEYSENVARLTEGLR